MRRLVFILPLIIGTPVFAEVTHTIDARFGVSYLSDPSRPQGQTRALYAGRYTSSYSHQADNGYRFRFDLGIDVGSAELFEPGIVTPLHPLWSEDAD